MKSNEKIEKELDNQFPKGDKARGRALVLVAVANIEVEEAQLKARQEAIEEVKELVKYMFRIYSYKTKEEIKAEILERLRS